MVIHETHKMIVTPVDTVECEYCWACTCHQPDTVFEEPCLAKFRPE